MAAVADPPRPQPRRSVHAGFAGSPVGLGEDSRRTGTSGLEGAADPLDRLRLSGEDEAYIGGGRVTFNLLLEMSQVRFSGTAFDEGGLDPESFEHWCAFDRRRYLEQECARDPVEVKAGDGCRQAERGLVAEQDEGLFQARDIEGDARPHELAWLPGYEGPHPCAPRTLAMQPDEDGRGADGGVPRYRRIGAHADAGFGTGGFHRDAVVAVPAGKPECGCLSKREGSHNGGWPCLASLSKGGSTVRGPETHLWPTAGAML